MVGPASEAGQPQAVSADALRRILNAQVTADIADETQKIRASSQRQPNDIRVPPHLGSAVTVRTLNDQQWVYYKYLDNLAVPWYRYAVVVEREYLLHVWFVLLRARDQPEAPWIRDAEVLIDQIVATFRLIPTASPHLSPLQPEDKVGLKSD